MHDHDDHAHGLVRDLEAIARQATGRRRALMWLGAGAASFTPLALVACGGGGDDTSSSTNASGSTGTTTTSGSCTVIPSETGGPYPGDGTNSNSGGVVNVLGLSGIVRSDIRSSIGGATGTAAGVQLTITLKLVNTNSSCANLAGYAIYLWHCNRDGNYSLYSSGVTDQHYL